jgi:hypothetical protein
VKAGVLFAMGKLSQYKAAGKSGSGRKKNSKKKNNKLLSCLLFSCRCRFFPAAKNALKFFPEKLLLPAINSD